MTTYSKPTPVLTAEHLQAKRETLQIWEQAHGPYEGWNYDRKALYHEAVRSALWP